MSKAKQTYNPCDDCQYSYSRNGQESGMCKICEFAYFRDLKPSEAEWIERYKVVSYLDDDVEVFYECSRCSGNCCGTPHYCPNCGSKMKGA